MELQATNQGGFSLKHIIETRNETSLKKILKSADPYNIIYIEIVRYGSQLLDRLMTEGWIQGALLFLKYYNINFDHQIKARCLLHKAAGLVPSDEEEAAATVKAIKIMLTKEIGQYTNVMFIGWTIADIDPFGRTAIQIAIQSDNFAAFSALIEKETIENKDLVDKVIVPSLSELREEYASLLSKKFSAQAKKAKDSSIILLYKAFEHKLSLEMKNKIFWRAISKGNKDVVQFMVEQCGIDPEVGDVNEKTAIEVAAQHGQASCVLYIFQKTVELKRTINKYNLFIILQSLLKHCPTENEKMLTYQKTIQIIVGYTPELVALTDAHGTTLLHIACSHANFPAIQTLCGLRASFSVKDKNGDHPLHILSRFTNPQVIEIFRWLVLNDCLHGVINEGVKNTGTMRNSQILRMMRDMKSKSLTWEHSDLQRHFWPGVIAHLTISDTLTLQHTCSFFKALIRDDLWASVLTRVGRMVTKESRLKQDCFEILSNALKLRGQQVLRERYNLKNIHVNARRTLNSVLVTSDQKVGTKYASFFSKIFGAPILSELEGKIYSSFIGYIHGGDIQNIKLKITIVQYTDEVKPSDKRLAEEAELLLINMDCFEIPSHFETFRLLTLRRPFAPPTTVVLNGKKRKGRETAEFELLPHMLCYKTSLLTYENIFMAIVSGIKSELKRLKTSTERASLLNN